MGAQAANTVLSRIAGDAPAALSQAFVGQCISLGRPMGAQAANTVLSRIAGDAPAALSQAFVGQCISLGRTHATFQMARTDDTPVNMYLGGRAAASLKEAICKGTVWSIRREAAKPGSYFWIKGGKRPAQSPTDEEVAAR